jgi:hypothetical protein
MTYINQQEEKVQEDKNVFMVWNKGALSKLKIKVIQGMIQVKHPFNCSIENTMKIANENKWIEIYNALKLNKLEVNKPKWDNQPNTTNGNNTEGI